MTTRQGHPPNRRLGAFRQPEWCIAASIRCVRWVGAVARRPGGSVRARRGRRPVVGRRPYVWWLTSRHPDFEAKHPRAAGGRSAKRRAADPPAAGLTTAALARGTPTPATGNLRSRPSGFVALIGSVSMACSCHLAQLTASGPSSHSSGLGVAALMEIESRSGRCRRFCCCWVGLCGGLGQLRPCGGRLGVPVGCPDRYGGGRAGDKTADIGDAHRRRRLVGKHPGGDPD